MQVTTTIFGHEFSNLQSLKDFAKLHNVIPTGNKTLKITWIEAIETYMEVQSEVVAMAVDADIEASQIVTTIEVAAVAIGRPVVAALTSETAVLVYRVALKAVAFALVMVWLLTVAAARWGWEHRSDTAVYHWVKDALSSDFALSAVTYLALGEWIVIEWVASIRSAVISTATTCRVWVGGLVEDARSVVG